MPTLGLVPMPTLGLVPMPTLGVELIPLCSKEGVELMLLLGRVPCSFFTSSLYALTNSWALFLELGPAFPFLPPRSAISLDLAAHLFACLKLFLTSLLLTTGFAMILLLFF